jgi:hypothetical protein
MRLDELEVSIKVVSQPEQALASANHAIKCSLGDLEHAAINTATTQQLDLEGIDVSGEFEARLWIRSDGLAFVSRFSFQNNIWPCQGMEAERCGSS